LLCLTDALYIHILVLHIQSYDRGRDAGSNFILRIKENDNMPNPSGTSWRWWINSGKWTLLYKLMFYQPIETQDSL